MLRHEADDQAAEIIGLLDEFQAAERAGAEAVDHWVTVCRDPRLRAVDGSGAARLSVPSFISSP